MSDSSFESVSHQAHESWYDKRYPDEAAKEATIQKWKQGSNAHTIENWLHQRMWQLANAVAQPQSNWLTVGDGYGLDAHYLIQRQCVVTASDISGSFLPLVKSAGFITDFSIQNAEQLTYADNAFDFILCKESYHHFPRPYLAVYEMLRVARQGIVLIEPHDPVSRMPLMLALRNTLDRIDPTLLQKWWKNRYSFEQVGNYVFKLSEREMEKLAMGMGLPGVAFKGINNSYYHPSTANEPASWDSRAFRKIQSKLRRDNFLAQLGILPYQLLCAIIFKTAPDQSTIERLQQEEFMYYSFPKNPYLK